MSRVKALAEALEGTDVSELDLTENGLRILIRRQSEPVMLAPAPVSASRARVNGAGHKRSLPKRAEASAPAPEPGVAIVAPLTGVFYSSPSPSSASFVEVGQSVQAGQVVCIVEAMKVFNQIPAEVSGRIEAMLVENGESVEFGQPLFRVNTRG